MEDSLIKSSSLIKKQDITNYQSFFKAKALFYGKITID